MFKYKFEKKNSYSKNNKTKQNCAKKCVLIVALKNKPHYPRRNFYVTIETSSKLMLDIHLRLKRIAKLLSMILFRREKIIFHRKN